MPVCGASYFVACSLTFGWRGGRDDQPGGRGRSIPPPKLFPFHRPLHACLARMVDSSLAEGSGGFQGCFREVYCAVRTNLEFAVQHRQAGCEGREHYSIAFPSFTGSSGWYSRCCYRHLYGLGPLGQCGRLPSDWLKPGDTPWSGLFDWDWPWRASGKSTDVGAW